MFALRILSAVVACGCFVLIPAQAATYKWVDDNGNTSYGDSVPPKYANRVTDRSSRAGSVKWDRTATAANSRPGEQETEKQKGDAKQQQERKRQDNALLSTYANEAEIELARERELRRNQEVLKVATAGLASSSAPEDKRRLDALINQGRQETDAINARFDAHKARYRELTGATTTAQIPAPAASK